MVAEEVGTEVAIEDSCLLELELETELETVTVTVMAAVDSAEVAVMKTPPGAWEAEAEVGADVEAD